MLDKCPSSSHTTIARNKLLLIEICYTFFLSYRKHTAFCIKSTSRSSEVGCVFCHPTQQRISAYSRGGCIQRNYALFLFPHWNVCIVTIYSWWQYTIYWYQIHLLVECLVVYPSKWEQVGTTNQLHRNDNVQSFCSEMTNSISFPLYIFCYV